MRVFYSCYGGTHTSVLCAGLHLGFIKEQGIPEEADIVGLPGFDTIKTEQLGHVTQVGVDLNGHLVFVASLGGQRTIAHAALNLLLREATANTENYIIVDSLRCIDWFTRVGGFLSRRLGWVSIGRPLVVYGLRRRLSCFRNIVYEVQSLLRASP